MFLLLNTKEDILKNASKQLLVATDFHSILYKSMATSICLLAFFKISYFVFTSSNNSIWPVTSLMQFEGVEMTVSALDVMITDR